MVDSDPRMAADGTIDEKGEGRRAAPAGATEVAQKDHFDAIADAYDAHYDDPASRRYRRRFIDDPLVEGLDLAGKSVLEAMCGSGHTTEPLLARGAQVTGLDISEAGIRSFRHRWPGCPAVRASLLASGLPDASFDVVVLVGGLHHLQPQVVQAVGEIHRLLRSGGMFCFMEPHHGSLPDWFRRRWYRLDPLFLDNEASIDLGDLKSRFRDRFDVVREHYGGNLAFLLVQNSFVFRVPLAAKRLYAPLLLWAEGAIGRWQGKKLSCFAVCQWRKKAAGPHA